MSFHALRVRARPLALVASACALWVACAAPRPTDPAHVAALGSPSLRDVFSIPGMHGSPPTLRSLSADGRFALVDFKPVERDAAGQLVWAQEHSPHLVETWSGPHELTASNALASWLEKVAPPAAPTSEPSPEKASPAEKEPRRRPGALAWSESGATLAVEWRGALVLLEPASGAAHVLYRDPPALADGAPVDRALAVSPPAEPSVTGIGAVRSLSFARDDRELEVRTASELYVIELAPSGAAQRTLERLDCRSEDLQPSIDKLQFSSDRTRVFLTAGTFGELDGDAGKSPTRFLERNSGRKLVLDGLAELKWLESERLSPDGRFVFGVEADRSNDPAPNLVPNFLTARVSTISARRDLADDLPPPRKLWMWNTRDGGRRELALPGDGIFHLQTLGWAPQPESDAPARYAFRRLSRDFRVLETWVWSDGDLRLVAIDRDPKWIGGPGGGARWRRDGRAIVFSSESFASSSTAGRAQLFELDVHTGAVKQLTRVEGEISAFAQVDRGYALLASPADPSRRELVLTNSLAEEHRFEFGAAMLDGLRTARDGSRAIVSLERLGQPAELVTIHLESGEQRALTRTLRAEYAAQRWILPQQLVLTHPDGSRVASHVYLPRSSRLERGDRPRPCVVFIHGAGYLQNVTHSMTEYAVNLMFHSRLAEMGYVVLDVDYRGSAGYGQRFRTDVQGHLGKLELEDIALCVDELARRKVIDAARVGCYGGSYGGFLTLMALFTEPERWSCGAALRSVTDWRSYSSGYTQPRLGRPSTDAQAYERSSPIDHAEKLVDPLLILHGMSDTNVFAQDSIRLMEKLIDLGKDFDAMLYPSQGHGFEDGPHWIDEYSRIERFMIRHLGAP